MGELTTERVIVEPKAVDRLLPIHQAQIYLKIAKLRIELLVNFNTKVLKVGLRRFAL